MSGYTVNLTDLSHSPRCNHWISSMTISLLFVTDVSLIPASQIHSILLPSYHALSALYLINRAPLPRPRV